MKRVFLNRFHACVMRNTHRDQKQLFCYWSLYAHPGHVFARGPMHHVFLSVTPKVGCPHLQQGRQGKQVHHQSQSRFDCHEFTLLIRPRIYRLYVTARSTLGCRNRGFHIILCALLTDWQGTSVSCHNFCQSPLILITCSCHTLCVRSRCHIVCVG